MSRSASCAEGSRFLRERAPAAGVSGDQAIKALERKGWRVHRTKGSHCALEHPSYEPTIVVPRHKELRPGTLNQILKTAEISREEFRSLIK